MSSVLKKEYDDEMQEYLNENIILYNEDDEEYEFEKIAVIALDDDYNLFHILKPVSLMEGMSDDEVLIFGYEDSEDGQSGNYFIVEDEELSDKVMEVYFKLLEAESENNK